MSTRLPSHLLTREEVDRLDFDPAFRASFGPLGERPLAVVEAADLEGCAFLPLAAPVVALAGGAAISPHVLSMCDVVVDQLEQAEAIARNVQACPSAAAVLVHHLRVVERLPAAAGLIAESLAFACLQGSSEFRGWCKTQPHEQAAAPTEAPLVVERQGNELRLTLNRASARNAIDRSLRDALNEALDLALVDGSIEQVRIAANGACFSVGGDVKEFGRNADPAAAHLVRILSLPAERLLRIGARSSVRVHGAVIGAGVEIAACCGTVVAAPRSWFQLPELRYGLLPGAGGTVSVSRRIGRHRTAYMALSMRRVTADTALAWGLVDVVE